MQPDTNVSNCAEMSALFFWDVRKEKGATKEVQIQLQKFDTASQDSTLTYHSNVNTKISYKINV